MAASGRLATEGVEPALVSFEGRCFRATGTDVGATDLESSSRRGARYDRPGDPQSFYASRKRHVALAELERRGGIQIAHFRITAVQAIGLLLDAYTRQGLLRLGLRRVDLVQTDNAVCLEVAELARANHASGLLVPSAAVEDESNVVFWQEVVPSAIQVLNWRIATPVELPRAPTDIGD
jgi:RES domain-containing protein